MEQNAERKIFLHKTHFVELNSNLMILNPKVFPHVGFVCIQRLPNCCHSHGGKIFQWHVLWWIFKVEAGIWKACIVESGELLPNFQHQSFIVRVIFEIAPALAFVAIESAVTLTPWKFSFWWQNSTVWNVLKQTSQNDTLVLEGWGQKAAEVIKWLSQILLCLSLCNFFLPLPPFSLSSCPLFWNLFIPHFFSSLSIFLSSQIPPPFFQILLIHWTGIETWSPRSPPVTPCDFFVITLLTLRKMTIVWKLCVKHYNEL